jgi:hypothetical protein
VTGLGKQKVILGYLWFKQTNPDINWKECTLTWQTKQDEKKPTPRPTIENKIDPEDWKNHTVNLIEELEDEQIGNAVLLSYIEEAKSKVWINAKTGIAMELVIKENEKKADLLVKKLIPEDLHDFLDVFDNNKANRFPESNVWDHKINMKEGLSDTGGTKRIGQVPGRKFGKGIYLTISITPSITFLLCQEERWKTSTMSRLSVPE